MNFNSLFTKITLVFIATLSLIISMFIFYLKYEYKQKDNIVINSHEKHSKYLFENKMPHLEVIKYLENQKFKVERNHREVLYNSNILVRKRGFESIFYNKKYYFHVLTPRFKILFEDLTLYEDDYSAYYLFAIFTIILIVIYLWLINSLRPLHYLREQISKFSSGDLNIDCSSNKKDEIADVANEFDNAVKEIDLLLCSRQLFLRTVMHELKTPIAKGRIVSELIDNKKQKDRLVLIFEKLDFLINDFAKVEQVVSKNYKLNIQYYNLEEILNNSINMLMLENASKKIKIDIQSNQKLQIDLDLLSMAIKNLIDNALKYSDDGKVNIKEDECKLLFISTGQALEKPFNDYFKPFHSDTTSKNHGMGLGLHIVHSILVLHNMKLSYSHKDGMNIFQIDLTQQ